MIAARPATEADDSTVAKKVLLSGMLPPKRHASLQLKVVYLRDFNVAVILRFLSPSSNWIEAFTTR